MDALGADFTIACPAFPANQRTIYKGYLFVGGVLLNESGMRDHPLTPMTDANVLQGQAKRRVGLVDYAIVARGASAIVERCAALRRESHGFAVVDAVSDEDLVQLGAACADLNHVYFENRSFSSSGSRRSLVQRRSATTKGSWFRRASKSATRRVRSSAQAWQW